MGLGRLKRVIDPLTRRRITIPTVQIIRDVEPIKLARLVHARLIGPLTLAITT